MQLPWAEGVATLGPSTLRQQEPQRKAWHLGDSVRAVQEAHASGQLKGAYLGDVLSDVGKETGINILTAGVGPLIGMVRFVQPVAKAINLPGWKKVTVDMQHIAERHMTGGPLTAGKSVFVDLNERGVMAAIKQAYGSATTVFVQGERALLSGVTKTGMTVEMWLNKATNVIETAYPVVGK